MADPSTPSSSATHPLEMILRLCAAKAPEPWYPRDHANATGTDRDELDPHLNRLRLAGLIRLTDWVKDHGQGYVLTQEGRQILEKPRELAQLSNGRMPDIRPTVEPPAAAVVDRREWDRGAAILDDLQRPQVAVVTNLLLATNIVWFLAGLALAQAQNVSASQYLQGPAKGNGVGEVVHQIGSLFGGDLVRGQWWRLLTCCFVHYGVMHIGVNMLSLVMIGPMLERMWGRWRFLAIYLIAGWGGSCTVMVVAGPFTQVAGASGALCGIFASAAVWILVNRSYLRPELSSAWLRQMLANFMLIAFISMMPGVSASAHFGGALFGAVAGYLANLQRFGSIGRRRLAGAGLVALPILGFAALASDMAINSRWLQFYWATETIHDAQLVESAGDGALRDYEKIQPLIVNYAPQRRDPDEVKKALSDLAERQTELTQAAAHLSGVGPYRIPAVEKARQAGIAYIQAVLELCRLAQSCLEGGENAKRDEKALPGQWRQAQQLRAAWFNALGQAGLIVTNERK